MNLTNWLKPIDVVPLAGRHVITVRRALESGELHGHQRVHGGRWQIHPDAVEAWIKGTNGEIACGCVAPRLRLAKRSA